MGAGTLRALLLVRAPEAGRQAFRQLVAYRLRTGIALSGIVVGVAAVVGSTTLTDAVALSIRTTYERIGGTQAGLVLSRPGTHRNGRFVRFPKEYPLTEEDRRFLLDSLPELEHAGASNRGVATVSNGRVTLRGVAATAIGPDHLRVRPLQLVHGRSFTAGEDERRERVALLFDVLAEDLFGRTDAVGEEVLVDRQRFRVIGILRRPPYWDRDFSRRLFFPHKTGLSRFGRDERESATWVKLRPGARWSEATPAILRLLVLRHPGSRPENFEVRAFGRFQDETLAALRAEGDILAAVALICLFTGGLGVLNVLLVSVTQRTFEIGLRIALGASRSAILWQILFEALVLCLLGGAAGLLAGQGVALGFAEVTRRSMEGWNLFDQAAFSATVGGKGLLVATGLTLLTSVLAGTYPAWRASRLDPAEALRQE